VVWAWIGSHVDGVHGRGVEEGSSHSGGSGLGAKTGEREKTVIDVVGRGSLGGYRDVIGGVGGDVITRCGSKRWVLRMFAWW